MTKQSADLVQRLVPTLYEDDDLLAVVKPAGVDAGVTGQAATTDLVGLLARKRGEAKTLTDANRLSRYESCVLLLGKNAAIVQHIRNGLRSNRIEQEYIAVVLGRMAQSPLIIDAAQGSSRGRRRLIATSETGRRLRRKAAPSSTKDATGTGRQTRQTVLRALRPSVGRTLVHCRTTVENTHALRAQLRAARLRLLGDDLHDASRRPRSAAATCLHLARISFHHPAKKRRVTLSSPAPTGFSAAVVGERDEERPLRAALTRRLPLITEHGTDAYRLLTGDVEDAKGLVAERFGEIGLLLVLDDRPALLEALPGIARWYRSILGLRAVYVKRFVKDRARVDAEVLAELHSPDPLVGQRVPPQIEVTERGLRFAIRPYAGFSVGLFLDRREDRSRVRSRVVSKDVLNLFAYTCAFSVAAAAGGANSVVSVDFSPKYLEWGRANFELNDLDPTKYQFITSDALEYLSRANRQGRRFDLIILDPPTFAHGRRWKRGFLITRDLAVLVAGAVKLLSPGGELLISTNHRKLSRQALRDRLQAGAGHRPYRIGPSSRPQIDFAADPDHSKTILARFE